MHPKMYMMIYFLNICPKRVVSKQFEFDHSLVFIFPSQKKISLKNYYNNNFFAMGTAFFFIIIAPLLSLPPQNWLDHVSG